LSDVVIYTRSWCFYCRRAKALLERKRVRYEEIDVEFAPTTLGVISGVLTLDTSATGPPVEVGLLGVGFVVAGLRSRHYWLTIWGTGLSLWSAGYIALVAFFL